MKDLHDSINPLNVIPPQSTSAATPIVGAIIDRSGYDSLDFVIHLGSNAGAAGAPTVLVEEGNAANLSDNTTVAATDLSGTVANANWVYTQVNMTKKIGYTGSKRYVRVTVTPTGNVAAMLLGVIAILGHPVFAPTPVIPA